MNPCEEEPGWHSLFSKQSETQRDIAKAAGAACRAHLVQAREAAPRRRLAALGGSLGGIFSSSLPHTLRPGGARLQQARSGAGAAASVAMDEPAAGAVRGLCMRNLRQKSLS